MADPAGEADGGALRLDFDRRLILRFHGSAITSMAACCPIASWTRLQARTTRKKTKRYWRRQMKFGATVSTRYISMSNTKSLQRIYNHSNGASTSRAIVRRSWGPFL